MSILKKNDLKKIFLDKLESITNDKFRNQSKDRHLRHMRKTRNRLHNEFDAIWVRYNNKQATFSQWENALEKWLSSECI